MRLWTNVRAEGTRREEQAWESVQKPLIECGSWRNASSDRWLLNGSRENGKRSWLEREIMTLVWDMLNWKCQQDTQTEVRTVQRDAVSEPRAHYAAVVGGRQERRGNSTLIRKRGLRRAQTPRARKEEREWERPRKPGKYFRVSAWEMNKGKTGDWYQGWLEREITAKRMA